VAEGEVGVVGSGTTTTGSAWITVVTEDSATKVEEDGDVVLFETNTESPEVNGSAGGCD
jgi:hypothetical protein